MSDQLSNSPFEVAKRKREQQDKEKEARKSFTGFEFENVSYYALEDNKHVSFRILGVPIEVRSCSTDPKLILNSQILKDDKKGYIKVNWPVVEKDGDYIPDSEWILTRLYKKVMERKWIKYEDGRKNERGQNGDWFYPNKDLTCYKRIDGNRKENDKYDKKFFPQKRVVMNVIGNREWCEQNNHSQMLISKMGIMNVTNENGEKVEIYFPDIGIPIGLYKNVFDHYIRVSGDWRDTDTVILKTSKEKKYDVYDKGDGLRYIPQNILDLCSDMPLSEKEKAYELYDLDHLYQVCSYTKLKRNLLGLFKLCDAELKTNFTEELETLVRIEAEERLQKKQESDSKDTEIKTQINESIEKPVEEEPKAKRERRPATDQKVEPVKSIEELCVINFPKWDLLSSEEKKVMIDSIKEFNNTVPTYITGTNDLLCPDKKCCFHNSAEATSYPDSVTICPVCGS